MEIFILFLLIVLNGIFALSEIALVTARKAKLQKWIDEGDAAAIAAIKLGEDPTRFLSTIQIGITSIGVLNGIVGEAALAAPLAEFLMSLGQAENYARPTATGLVVVVITYFSIVIGELVPKRVAQHYPETFARFVSRPIEGLAVATKPFVYLLSFSTKAILRLMGIKGEAISSVTEEEIHAVLAEGTSAGVIESHEHLMVRNVFRLDDRKIGSLMVPRADVVVLDVELSFEENVERILETNQSFFPVIDGNFDNLLGIVNAKQWLATALQKPADRDLLKQVLQAPLYVPETLTGMQVLDQFRSTDVKMAIVIDEYSEILGIITLQELIEAITGEFHDRDPESSWALQRDDGSWLLDGHIPIPELKDRLQLSAVPDEDKSHYHTLSGMMMLLIERLPALGDRVEWEQWSFEIIDMDGKTIDKVLATAKAPLDTSNNENDPS